MAKAGRLPRTKRNKGVTRSARPGAQHKGIGIMKIVVIVTAGLALLLGGCTHTSLPPVSDANFTARDKQQLANPPYQQASIPLAYQRQVVPYHRNEAPGTVLVDTDARFVYYVLPEGRAIRYGAIVGEDGQAWPRSAARKNGRDGPRLRMRNAGSARFRTMSKAVRVIRWVRARCTFTPAARIRCIASMARTSRSIS